MASRSVAAKRGRAKRKTAAKTSPPREAFSKSQLGPRELRSLCEPYLRGFRPVSQTSGVLRGCWFVRFGDRAPLELGSEKLTSKKDFAKIPAATPEAGFFVGYLVGEGALAELEPAPPECLAGAFVAPVGGAFHGQLVSAPGSLFRGIFTYIGWLTHRKPRFVFCEAGLLALVRHASMRDWPAAKHQHLSRNFFIESLAWLVRSGLVKRLRELPAAPTDRG